MIRTFITLIIYDEREDHRYEVHIPDPQARHSSNHSSDKYHGLMKNRLLKIFSSIILIYPFQYFQDTVQKCSKT